LRENLRRFSLYSPREGCEAAPVYEGLDAMRVFSSFGVVFLHVCAATGTPQSLETFLKFRDFALPVLVMMSFFLLTASFIRHEEKDFGQFFIRRFARLWIPFFVWTLFYILLTCFLVPLMTGFQAAESFSPLVFLTGYRHLWYLQFLFIGSLLVYYCVLRFTLRFFRPKRENFFSYVFPEL
jgi:peptidoglycan/LPS O-acetylase OafA/YrhL